MLKHLGATTSNVGDRRRRATGRVVAAALVILVLVFSWVAATLHSTGLRWGRTLVLGPFFSGTVWLKPGQRLVILPSRSATNSMRWQADPVGPGWTLTLRMPRDRLWWDRQGTSGSAVVRWVWGFYSIEPWPGR
jgi:hypothetical protein